MLAGLHQLGEFDQLIDVRSPAEFAEDHLPGAINCPVLDDAERAQVGTLYCQHSPFAARKVGAALVSRNIARHLETCFAGHDKSWRPLIYCWRGGQRSAAMTLVLNQVGWAARQLEGGYKAYRRQVLLDLAQRPQQLRFRVLCGPTGCGKSRLLAALAAQGAQVLDLEGLACHRGSVLGLLPDAPQPGQKAFDSALWQALQGFDAQRTVWVEAESKRVGRLHLPDALWQALRRSPCLRLNTALSVRIAALQQDYAALCADHALFARQLARLTELHGRQQVAAWQALLAQGDWPQLAQQLIEQHYDPAYGRGGAGQYQHAASAPQIDAPSLSPQALALLARQLLVAEAAP